jgi:hypothetical protein
MPRSNDTQEHTESPRDSPPVSGESVEGPTPETSDDEYANFHDPTLMLGPPKVDSDDESTEEEKEEEEEEDDEEDEAEAPVPKKGAPATEKKAAPTASDMLPPPPPPPMAPNKRGREKDEDCAEAGRKKNKK